MTSRHLIGIAGGPALDFAQLFALVDEPYAVLDADDGRILATTRGYQTLAQRTAGELEGRQAWLVLARVCGPTVDASVARRWCAFAVNSRRVLTRPIGRYLVTHEPIVERDGSTRLILQRVTRIASRAGAQPQMSAELLHQVSREVNGPLCTIRGLARTLHDEWPRMCLEQQLELLDTVQAETERLSASAAELLWLLSAERGMQALPDAKLGEAGEA